MNMINVIATIYVKEGRMSEFIDIFKSNIPNVLNETGCVEYIPTIDLPMGLTTQQCNENVVTIIEKWHSLDDLKSIFQRLICSFTERELRIMSKTYL
jgi:quinol monooxygenase YgiN